MLGSGRADGPDYDDPEVQEAAQCMGLSIILSDDTAAQPPGSNQPYALWPEHDAAAGLFMACLGQLSLHVGPMGGTVHTCCRASEVRQEAVWMGLRGALQAKVVAQYRIVEREALRLLNDR